MKLYELTERYNNLYELFSNESVPVEVVEDALKGIEDEIEVKFENMAKLIRTLEGEVKIFKDEEKRLNMRRVAMENKIKSLKEYMLHQLEIMKKDKIQANTFVIRKQKNPQSIEVVDPKLIDKKYLIPQEPKIDTKAIKQDLDNGVEIKGVMYKPESYHLRIQ